MSQTSWSRKSQQPEFGNGHIESKQENSQRAQGESTTSPFASSNLTIPPNKGGKRYKMSEVFQVWLDSQDQILSPNVELPVNSNENYKLTKPGKIYHLDLQPSFPVSNNQDKQISGSALELVESLENLKTNEEPSTIKSQGPPPGMNRPINEFQLENGQIKESGYPVITSDKIEWFYVDPSGNEQGPFNGDMMQEWLTDGYLNLDLKLRRSEESTYQTLKELCDKVQNYIQPFKVPLPLLSNLNMATNEEQNSFAPSGIPSSQSQLHQFLSGGPGNINVANMRLNSSMNPQGNLFGNDFMNHHNDPFASPLTPLATTAFSNPNQFGIESMNSGMGFSNAQTLSNPLQHINNMPSLLLQQNPCLSGSNGGWGIDAQNGLIGSTPGTPVSVAPVLPSQMSQQPMSPWFSGVQSSLSRVGSPFIPSTTLNASEKQDSEKTSSPIHDTCNQHDPVLDEIHTAVVTGILNDGEEEFSQQAIGQTKLKQKQKKVQLQPKQLPSEENKLEQNQSVSQSEPKTQQIPELKESSESKDTSTTTADPISTTGNELKAGGSQQKLAPWAVASNKQGSSTKPALTLKEIQMVEAEKVKEQKQIEAAIKSEQLAKSKLEEKVAEEKPSLPKTSSWGINVNTKVPATAKKTLAEIQKEEFEAAKAKAKSTNSASGSGVPSNSSFATALANSVPKDDSPWTVVTPKKPISKKPSQPTITTTTTSASKANPQLLRSVSAVNPVKSSTNSLALKEEFLIWARSSMTNLYPTVSKDDLLDIFTTLPLNNDSSQLISETIYSSSATMDGRRFAQEFLKRRQRVEQQIGPQDEVSWGSAILSSADKVSTIDEEGWSTSVKSKKKNKKF